MRTIDTQVADDGTELKLKRKRNGNYIVTEAGSDQRTGEVVRTREEGQRLLAETARLYGRASRADRRESRQRRDQGFGDFGGGFFGGPPRDDDREPEPLLGDPFGGDDRDEDSKSIFDAVNELFRGRK